MKAIRIFISSPGDVAKERQRAREVVESLRRRYSRHFMLQPILWEDLPLQSDMPFQHGIEAVLSEKGADIAIFILWTRLGSPLGNAITRPDGTPYRSGTEREYDLIIQARAAAMEREGKARPDILVYTRRDDASFEETLRGTSTDKKDELIQQKKRVESFLAETFRDKETGTYLGAYFPFDRPVTFSQRLRTHLVGLLDQMAGESTDVIWDTEKQGPPFLGLEAFQPRHEAVFFGREEEIIEARHALKEQARDGCAFLLLSGASGSGKSSLARAGVLPAIVELEVDEQVAAWRSLIMTPSQLGADPITALVTSLAADDILPALRAGSSALPDLVAGLRKDPELTFNLRLKDAFAKASANLGGSVRLLLVLDQLEELFTASAISADDRTAFLAVIETFARSGSIWVLATVRSDFYQQVQSEPTLVRMKSGHGQLDVLPPGPDALARIIEEPARLAGLVFEKRDDQSLSGRIIKDAATHAELLPLVEFVLRELYENRTAAHALTFAAYEALGGVEGALAKRAEDIFGSLPGDAQESLASVLQALVTLGSETEALQTGGEKFVRQRAPLADFDSNPAGKRLVEAFVAARLFTTCQIENTGEPAVTVAHESLLRVWPRARAWADNNRDFLHTRARIAARMAEGSPLLKGDPLLEATKAHLHTNGAGFTARQREWITQAIAAATGKERQITRRRRLAIASLSILTVMAMASAGWAFKREHDTEVLRQQATKAKQTAEGIIESMLFGLRDKLAQIGRTELLDDVSKQAEDYFKNNPSTTTIALRNEAAMWNNRGDVFRQSGDLKAARAAYEKELEIRHRLAAAYPLVAQFQQDLGITYQNFGRIATVEGDLEAARSAYETSLEIHQRFAAADPGNAEAQEWVGIEFSNIGDIARAEDDLKAARAAYEKSLEISQRLAAADPRNARVQGSLGISYAKLGHIALEEGDLEAARAAFEACLKIHQQLAAADPRNSSAQQDLGISYSNIGDITRAEDDLKAARAAYEKSLEISQRLAAADPRNAEVQRDLGISYAKLGDIARAEGDLKAARAACEACLATHQRLVAADPGNAEAQMGLVDMIGNLGDIAKTEGDLKAARAAFEKCLEIRQRLAAADPRNAEVQRGLGISYAKLGHIALEEGDLKAARTSYENGLAIHQRLAAAAPRKILVQRQLGMAYDNLGGIARAEGDLKAARAAFEKCLEIHQRLAAADPRNAKVQRDLAAAYANFSSIAEAEGDLNAARTALEKDLEITQGLAVADPRVNNIQQNLGVIYNKLGRIAEAEGDLKAARAAFEQELAAGKRLVEIKPNDPKAECDYAVSFSGIGRVALADGDLKAARAAFEQFQSNIKRLSEAHPGDSAYKTYLAKAHLRLAQVAEAEKNSDERTQQRRQCHAVLAEMERLKMNPADPDLKKLYPELKEEFDGK